MRQGRQPCVVHHGEGRHDIPEAIRHLAKKYNIQVQEDKAEKTEQQNEDEKKRESMFIIYKAVADFYRKQIFEKTPEAIAALSYVNRRWNHRQKVDDKSKAKPDEDKDFGQLKDIGYAPNKWDALVTFAQGKGYSLKLMEEAGLIKISSKGNYIDVFRDRIMIPITDKWGRVIAFTARTMQDDADTAKYINNKDSFIFHKGANIFGLDIARRKAISENKMYCVEGAPDAMTLQAIGADNTVAALGASWTDAHFEMLKSLFGRHNTTATLCWIPDSDQKAGQLIGPGTKIAINNGKKAMEHGFRVTVKEIPQGKDGKKEDADSYITSLSKLNELDEEDFVIWYASKIFNKDDNTTEKSEKIKEICSVAILIQDEYTQNAIIDKLGNKYGSKNIWRSAQKQAIKDYNRKKAESISKSGDIDTLKTYGFYESKHCIFSANGKQWSNFIMRPLFHIKDVQLEANLQAGQRQQGGSTGRDEGSGDVLNHELPRARRLHGQLPMEGWPGGTEQPR